MEKGMGMRYDESMSLMIGEVYGIVVIARADRLEDETDETF